MQNRPNQEINRPTCVFYLGYQFGILCRVRLLNCSPPSPSRELAGRYAGQFLYKALAPRIARLCQSAYLAELYQFVLNFFHFRAKAPDLILTRMFCNGRESRDVPRGNEATARHFGGEGVRLGRWTYLSKLMFRALTYAPV